MSDLWLTKKQRLRERERERKTLGHLKLGIQALFRPMNIWYLGYLCMILFETAKSNPAWSINAQSDQTDFVMIDEVV